jgi:tetratricopeptide (TPR) repeat protein
MVTLVVVAGCLGLGGALAAEPVVTAAATFQIDFDATADAEVAGALADLRAGAFDAAARRFGALADAGGGVPMRTLQAVALYEAGDVRLAEGAVAAGLAAAPRNAPLLSLKGLILADLGRGREALAALDAARDGAGGDRALVARTEVNRALVHVDQGDPAAAEAALGRARPLAAGDAGLLARIDELAAQARALRGEVAPDALGQVGDRLSRGDLAGARAALSADAGTDRRSRLRRALAEGTLARAEGKHDAAYKLLASTASEAASHGLLRELAAAEAQLGVVHGASNRPELAVEVLLRAVDRVAGTSHRVAERSYRIEAGRMALRAGDAAAAERQLKAAAAIPTADPGAAAHLQELRGEVAARRGDVAGAGAAFAEAAAALEGRSAWMDAARVWVADVTLRAGAGDGAGLQQARSRALAAFASAKDPLGPAHVAVAEGIGLAERDDVEGALAAFGRAIEAAGGSGRGPLIARVAKENAAKVVAQSTGSAEVLARAGELGIDDLVARARTYLTSRAAYDEALTSYQAERYPEAAAGFDRAVRGMESIGERAHAQVARRGRAWARFNATSGADATAGWPVWQALVEEASLLGDTELRVRAMVATALAAGELERPEAGKSLRAAADQAEAMGLGALAGQCQAALVEVTPALDDKVTAARKAHRLRGGDTEGVYALYSASVAAYEAGAYEVAIELAEQAEPGAEGELAAAVRQVLDAARASR